jgi:hypothetical protein
MCMKNIVDKLNTVISTDQQFCMHYKTVLKFQFTFLPITFEVQNGKSTTHETMSESLDLTNNELVNRLLLL